ncbi:MAG: ribosome-binding factor A [Bdellovibrionales bacterium]|nr:ribosome-binding factor A [Bdellovibrionales bacterium]
MSDGRRPQRVQKELSHLVSQYLLMEWRGPHPGIFTVVAVDVTPDLRSAKVFISVLLTEAADFSELEEAFEEQRNQIQSYVGRNLKMKFTPRLNFKLGTQGDLISAPSKSDS